MRLKSIFLTAIAVLLLAPAAFAQNPHAALASLPEADALIYVNPQKILNEAGATDEELLRKQSEKNSQKGK